MTFPGNGLRAVFSLRGRIGRARYIAYRSAVLLAFGLVFIGFSLLTGVLPPGWRLFMGILILLATVSALVFYTLPAVRRAHDFNASGWLALLSLIPLLNLAFWFIPGTAGSNRHGDAPPANSRLLVVSAVLLPLLVFLLFLYFAWMGVMSYQWASTGRGATAEQAPASAEPPGEDH
ncbi:MAG: DUF805 domain-containing protein [Pseudomonadota bacterium]